MYATCCRRARQVTISVFFLHLHCGYCDARRVFTRAVHKKTGIKKIRNRFVTKQLTLSRLSLFIKLLLNLLASTGKAIISEIVFLTNSEDLIDFIGIMLLD